MTQHIRESCGLYSSKLSPIKLYEDNTTCIAQIKGSYIKDDNTHDLKENDDIIVQQICSKDNLADLFTKSLPTATFEKLVHNIGMQRRKDLK